MKLDQAQRAMRNRNEYDEVAKMINKYPSRQDSER